jgi:aminoglycoside phosphotransferase (APT) family kinase protein
MNDAHTFRPAIDTHAIDADRLAAYLQSIGMRLDRDQPIQQFATGLANINYRLTIDGADMVLRRPPDGDLPPGAHDMKREHRVLSKLSKVFSPAPDSIHLCEDTTIIGVPFHLMEYRPGRVIKGDNSGFIDGKPERAAQIGEMLVASMIALHDVDADQAGLSELGRPDGFVERAIKGWRTRAARLEPHGEMLQLVHEIGSWLDGQTTQSRPPTLLHCDFKLDNCILDPDTLELRAIVDWDMGTRGHHDELLDRGRRSGMHAPDGADANRYRRLPDARRNHSHVCRANRI